MNNGTKYRIVKLPKNNKNQKNKFIVQQKDSIFKWLKYHFMYGFKNGNKIVYKPFLKWTKISKVFHTKKKCEEFINNVEKAMKDYSL